ncbi:MAG TPA: response regulator [Terriglobales bacterium]|nr:response regulator [Terriglobales bacterium]
MKYQVLLVDDEEPILRLLKTVLEMADFSVSVASSASEAIKVLRQELFDVVVTDLRMETPLAGYEVVRAAGRCEHIPLRVILTAFPVPPVEWRRSGADALITKGGESLRLAERLKALLLQRHPHPTKPPEHRQPSK